MLHQVMIKDTTFLLGLAVTTLVLSSCATRQIPDTALATSSPMARALLEEAREAHGGAAFDQIRDISVRYDGTWGKVAARVQSVLVDPSFRQGSEERLILSTGLVAQRHEGPGGEKWVRRGSGEDVVVVYNGDRATDDEVLQAAALVADAYTMFLLGPFYFDRSGVVLDVLGEGEVDGSVCDEVLAVLRPGFGKSEEDRVVLSLDRSTRQLRRIRMTLFGLASTAGAEVDITFSQFQRVGGMLWPTDFVERIRVPFEAHAHHWQLLGIDFNRGLRPGDLGEEGWSGAALPPAATLP